jgi:hypothetical protein
VAALCGMFPETPRIYFEDSAEELVGKPAAIDRWSAFHWLILNFAPSGKLRNKGILNFTPGTQGRSCPLGVKFCLPLHSSKQ